MKKVIIPVMALAIGFASCDKVDTKPTTTTTTPTTTTPTAPTPVTPATPSGYWGALAAVKMKFSYSNPQLPMEIPAIESQIGTAVFYDNISGGTVNMVDAGAVSVNSNNLPKQSNNSYLVNATVGQTPSTLDLGTNVNWKVGGGNGIPAITYNHSGTFPDYSGKLPTSIDKSKDLVINLGSDIAGADSVYIVIATSGKTIMKSVVGKPAPATVTIKASELSGLPTVTDNTAYLEVVPFTYAYPNISGKDFVFIKETAVVSAVSIQ